MNNTISVYELLGLIKDGKAPKKIKILGLFYEYDDYCEFYFDKSGNSLYRIFYDAGNCFDEKVEILEEDKPIIEKIKRYEFKENGITISEQPSIIEIADKLNEVIDYINRREDK